MTRMTRMQQMCADFYCLLICEDLLHPRRSRTIHYNLARQPTH